jgi:hypothetical protein
VIFVPAGEEHRFDEVTEDLALLVVFGPAYGSRQAISPPTCPPLSSSRHGRPLISR